MSVIFVTRIVVAMLCLCTAQAAWEYRIVNGASNWGRLEGRSNGASEWGTVCNDRFGYPEAKVACRWLGLPHVLATWRLAAPREYGNSIQPIVMDNLGCSGNEASLDMCPYVSNHNCLHSEDVILGCGMVFVPLPNLQYGYRLSGGNPLIGRLEVKPPHDSRWGTVCDDLFDVLDAKVACRTLGLPEWPVAYRAAGAVDQGTGPIWMSHFTCLSIESSLNQCISSGLNDCTHPEDIILACGHTSVPALSAAVIPAGAHRLCAQVNVPSGPPTLFDVWTDASGTTMDRWNMATSPPTFMDRNTFAALHLPDPAGSMWGEGVAFAATMQSRLVWTNTRPNTDAWWQTAENGADTWRFATTFDDNQAREIVFSTMNCRWDMPAVPSTPPAPAGHRVCLKFTSASAGTQTYFDIRTDASETRMHRWNMLTSPPTYINMNTFAALHLPSPLGSMWGEGVAFAATMQSRLAWVNTEPNVEAWWEVNYATGKDTWRFSTVVDGTPTELVLRTSQCLSLTPPV